MQRAQAGWALAAVRVLGCSSSDSTPAGGRDGAVADEVGGPSSTLVGDTPPPSPTTTIADGYPGDQDMASDPRVLFHSDFESGLAR
jgi:hypothetical protein